LAIHFGRMSFIHTRRQVHRTADELLRASTDEHAVVELRGKLTRLESDVALSARYASASSLTVSWSRRLTAISSQRDCGVTHFQRQHRNNDNNVALCMPCCGTVPRSRSSRLIGSPERQVILSTVTRSGCPRFDRCQDLHAFSTTRVSRLHMHVAETFSILRMQKQNRDGSYKSYQIFGPL